MKRDFIKIDFSEVSKLDDNSLHVLSVAQLVLVLEKS